MSGCVLRQNDTIDTQMKNTEIIPIIYEKEGRKYLEIWSMCLQCQLP